MCFLPGILGKHVKFRNLFCLLDRRNIPAILSNLEPGAQLKLGHAYYVFPLWTLGRWYFIIYVHSVICSYLLSNSYILMVLFKYGLQRTYSQKAITAFCLTRDKVFKAKFNQNFTAFVNRVLATKGKYWKLSKLTTTLAIGYPTTDPSRLSILVR